MESPDFSALVEYGESTLIKGGHVYDIEVLFQYHHICKLELPCSCRLGEGCHSPFVCTGKAAVMVAVRNRVSVRVVQFLFFANGLWG